MPVIPCLKGLHDSLVSHWSQVSLFTIADQDILEGAVGNVVSHPPTQLEYSVPCSLRAAPPRRLSEDYNRICITHKKLVKAGVVQCSVSLSDTPPSKVNLPISPSSPIPPAGQVQGSVHWGAVGDFSGVRTPDPVLHDRPSVIVVPPSSLPAVSSFLPPPSSRRAVLPSPTLLEGVASLLRQIPPTPDSSTSESSAESTVHHQETPHLPRRSLPRRKISSTDHCFLDLSGGIFPATGSPQATRK